MYTFIFSFLIFTKQNPDGIYYIDWREGNENDQEKALNDIITSWNDDDNGEPVERHTVLSCVRAVCKEKDVDVMHSIS